ncbi:SWI/SNF-related matrix-associated actin-dependent regulator of chromatin subfamily A-like protein 1 isoform X4 [Phalaenopsis equestris]|uniref:SWI/SNF-related matrix-associated actin-dependent regulator of chromatin subfamily A-like protein 1 isoform X4 n=1 Tax=Phalaenopsis equestris TaxID=78828 RepID=UPI0009E64993|nr:SWI/SNF-related matrix-associated actin-dependent regulator of chromatin subfamily A-like protein 1 isoform X4 [Phalaenopsis equestris]
MDRLDEDWDFSAEELELLEQDAFRKIAERKLSSATAGSSCCSPSVSHLSPPASASIYKPCQAPPSRTSLESRYDNVEVPSGLLDDNSLSTNDLPQLSVRLYLHSTGLIAAKFSYSPILVQAVHKVPKASWRPEERLWLFPLSSLKTAEHVFSGVSGANVELQSLDPLACRAIVCANAAPDLSALYDRIPSYLESKLLPFQREGVRFVLQHGGRALLADEMGLGKTLQALAVASSLGESWPVLVLTPSSLRLHWASMIHQWLGIPAGDILVVLSQAGSTRGGFKIVFSSQKLAIRLDGTFNIVSYDSVPKLQNVLLSSAFKVFLDLNEKDLKETRALFRELEVIKSKIQTCTEENLKALKFTQKNLISKIYNHSAEAKIPAVLDYLSTVIEADCKFLVFAHHLPMIEAMHQFFLKKKVGCIRIDGSTPATSRQALVTQFQENSEIKAAVLSILAGGVGINLTAASTVIFAELSWTPGDLIQAEDRVHRIGQVTSVNIYYLLANETVDDIIWDVVQSKLENLGQVLDGEENTLEVACSQTMSSPAKQKTLDSFLKRCPSFPTTSPKTKILKY